MYQHLILISCFLVESARAKDQWDEFTDNLATDLAPLISLFGERLTKQFLSESVDLLDNIIFALAPLGILTALVSVIRVRGGSSLRAFVGRAQEGPGEAENELLSCVSETTGELFNDNGISRIFGRPRILEVVIWEDYDDQIKQRTWKIGTLRDALREGSWSACQGNQIFDEKGSFPELDIPNLSLNKGIERRHRNWFYCAAVVGFVLQFGVIAYAAVTVFLYPKKFPKDGKPVDDYVFPLFLSGTLLLCTGMFLCAFIIKRSSSKYYLHAGKPSKLYWLQPGRQHGDQVFNAFLGCTEGPKSQATDNLKYIKTIRNQDYEKAPLLLTVCVTVLGFVAQFVGLRGLHATVILTQLGSTLVMSVVRTCLRTKRIGPQENRLSDTERQLVPYRKQELDCFAFHLEKAKSFSLVSGMKRTPSSSSSSSQSSLFSSNPSTDASINSIGLGTRLIQTRTRLAELTSATDEKSGLTWDDLPIRKIAVNLAEAIETTMNLISSWKDATSDNEGFEISLVCQSDYKSISPILETHTIILMRSDDTLRWRVNVHELEAVIGLWTWSLLNTDNNWLQDGLGRLVGFNDSEARTPETDLYFHKWIFRKTEAKMVSSKMISLPQQMFGFYSDEYPDNSEVLVMKTKNRVETMVAQDIFIQFIRSAFDGLEELGGELSIRPGSQNGLLAHSSRLDDLVACFESSYLGSMEDALLCIVPVLRQCDLLPELSSNSDNIKGRIERLICDTKWSEALSTVYWLCERCEGTEFERCAIDLGHLCRRALVHSDANVQSEGLRYTVLAMQGDPRTLFFKNSRNRRAANWMDSSDQSEFWRRFSRQLGWVAWHIAENNSNKRSMQAPLESLGINGASIPRSPVNNSPEEGQRGRQAVLEWLSSNDENLWREMGETEDQLALDWVCQDTHDMLLEWLIARWVGVDKQCPGTLFYIILWAAGRQQRAPIISLCRHGVSLEMQYPGNGLTAMIQSVANDDNMAVSVLLEAGAKVDGRSKGGVTPLMTASQSGNSDAVTLLLGYGADINAQDINGTTPLICSVSGAHFDLTQTLLQHGADVNMSSIDGETALISAVDGNDVGMVKLLLSWGADVNTPTISGTTALTMTVLKGYYDIMKILLDYRADVHGHPEGQRSALDWAREIDNVEGIQLLASFRSDPNC
ncbi:hypothetical protein FE257_000512 [Aspergillus nanangensis]|uniref:Uncharacterized protein n=1 Tax=Aspergillus nanangensis TaxID=2582783 RepID=A0AAD4CUG5_ASPNN|nr:hypothetical protein FE257_000512 [Aspergillus nanangensis]